MQKKDIRYPIGPFSPPEEIVLPTRRRMLGEFANIPAALRKTVSKIPVEKLDTPWRPGGWTLRQVIHHIADSHMNGFIRCKLALTEKNPDITRYSQPAWAECPDALLSAVSYSIDLLTSLHIRWLILFENISEEEWKRSFHHPEMGDITLETALALYTWHGKHHTEQLNAWLRGETGTS